MLTNNKKQIKHNLKMQGNIENNYSNQILIDESNFGIK